MLREDQTTPKARPHVYELDRLRVVTVFSVVAVHVLANTTFLDPSRLALQVQNAFVTALHFTRELFLFVTAFALVYVYDGKRFALWRFWKRRGLGVVLPYLIWSGIYLWVTLPTHGIPLLWHTFYWDVLTGNASYQLYYILLTIQFYLIFPWFLAFLRRVGRHPWMTLAVSFALEVITLFVISTYGQQFSLPGTVGLAARLLQDRFLLDYQFYLVLGGLAALYLQAVRTFVLQHQTWILGSLLAALLALELHYIAAIEIEHTPILTAVAVMQPMMAFYSVAAIAFLSWFASRRVVSVASTGRERSTRIWGTLSNASFGIYLVHPFFLTHLLPLLAVLSAWPALILVPLTWAATGAASILFCVVVLNIPFLSRLVGREQPMVSVLAALRHTVALRTGGHRGLRWPLRALARRAERASVSPREEPKQSKEGIRR